MATASQDVHVVDNANGDVVPEYSANGKPTLPDVKAPLSDSEKLPIAEKDVGGPSDVVVASPTSDVPSGHPTSVDADAPVAVSPVADVNRHATGTFAQGAAVSSGETPTGTLDERAAVAEGQLSAEAKSKILKSETKNSKQMIKILKAEAKAQAQLLKTALKELARLQKIQKQASKDESKALSTHTKAVRVEQKTSQAFNKAKADFERAVADLKSSTEALENTREHAKTQTEALKQKSLEVDAATKQKMTDDREREAKISTLKGTSA